MQHLTNHDVTPKSTNYAQKLTDEDEKNHKNKKLLGCKYIAGDCKHAHS